MHYVCRRDSKGQEGLDPAIVSFTFSSNLHTRSPVQMQQIQKHKYVSQWNLNDSFLNINEIRS